MPRKETKQEATKEKNIDVSDKVVPKVQETPKVIAPEGWSPKTKLGKDVIEGRITDIDDIFRKGIKITESEIVDVLIPNLDNEIILIGGSTGKGGGIRRTPSRRTTRMHKSGRRYRISVMVVVGNKNGYLGIGTGGGPPGRYRDVVKKALHKAKLNIIPIRRGCGSWECKCGGAHTIPFEVNYKLGSTAIELIPAPKGIGLCVSDEVKKLMRLAGITDIWCKTRGKTQTRINLIKSAFYALRKLNKFKTNEEYIQSVGMKLGKVE